MPEQKTIGIFTFKLPQMKEKWDPDSIKDGISGSEEAIIYMSQCLAQLGYKVIVFADPPPGSPYSSPDANPLYLDKDICQVSGKLDIGIAWRMPYASKIIRKIAHKVYFWCHDAVTCFPFNDDDVNEFDDALWLSEWQREHYIKNYNQNFAKFTKIFGNGISSEQFEPVQERTNPYSCVYSSSWGRGLEELLDVWPIVKQEFPRATLDIYYGPQGLTEEKTQSIRNTIANLSGVTDHGKVSHKEINKAYARASFWTYPCVVEETFCITALRAQLSGAIPVIRELAALSETVRHGLKCTNPKWYLSILLAAMQNAEKITLEDRRKMGEFVLEQYTWEKIARKWKTLFDSHLI